MFTVLEGTNKEDPSKRGIGVLLGSYFRDLAGSLFNIS